MNVFSRAALRRLDPGVWLVLLHSAIFGLALSVADLLFNFYLVSLGYGKAEAGLLSTVGRVAGALLGLPIGMLIDRAGARRALLGGLGLYALGWALLIGSTALWALATAQFLAGAAQILCLTSVVPLLTAVTDPAERPAVFGLNASASNVIGLVGSLVGGALPGLAGLVLRAAPQSALTYRVALAAVVLLGMLAALPVLRLVRGEVGQDTRRVSPAALTSDPPVALRRLLWYSVPSLFLGLAGGALLPFQNLFYRERFGLGDATVGAVLAVAALGMGIGGVLGAPVSARFGLKGASGWLRLASAPALLLMLLPILPVSILGFFLRGMAVSASYPLNDALMMQRVPPRQRGLAVSLTSISWTGGWSIASVLSGWAQERAGFTPPLVVAALMYLVSGAAILLSRSERDP